MVLNLGVWQLRLVFVCYAGKENCCSSWLLEAKDLVVSSSGIRTAADFSPPFSKISPASSAFPIPSLLGAGPTACKDESEVNWAQSDFEEEEELEEIALEPDFTYSTCNPWEEKADYTAYRRLHTKTDASTFGHLVPNDSIAVCMTPLPSSRLSRELGGAHLLLQLWVPYPEATISAPLADPRKWHPLSRSCGCCKQRVWHDVLFSQPPQQKRHCMLRPPSYHGKPQPSCLGK